MNKHLNRASTEGNTFSPYFLYDFFGNNHGKIGAGEADAYLLMKNKGCLPWDGESYDNTYADWNPNLQAWEEADNYRLKKYEFLSIGIGTSAQQITSPKDSDLDTIKTALNNGEVLTFSTYVYKWDIKTIKSSDIAPENNSFAGEKLDVSVSAESSIFNSNIGYATPFYLYHKKLGSSSWETDKLSFTGKEYEEDGTMVMDLDTVIPNLNSENFKDYNWSMNIFDKTLNDYSCIIKSAKIIDYNTGKIYPVEEELPKTVNGNSENLTFSKEYEKGFDFKISNIGYQNESKKNNSTIAVGDKIRFNAKVENVGNIKATDNNKMGVLFSVNGTNTWSDDYRNKPGLLPGQSEILTANGGGLNGDGTVSFSEPGTYTVTAWVNDQNDFPDEYGGNFKPIKDQSKI